MGWDGMGWGHERCGAEGNGAAEGPWATGFALVYALIPSFARVVIHARGSSLDSLDITRTDTGHEHGRLGWNPRFTVYTHTRPL